MNWFERHLNWSLFLALLYTLGNVGFTIGLIASIGIFAVAFIKVGGGFSLLAFMAVLAEFLVMARQAQTILAVITIIVTCLLIILFTLWFLDRKGRSKSFVLLFIISWALGLIAILNVSNYMAGYFVLASILGNILTFIVLLLLGNERSVLEIELLAQRLDTEQVGAYDDWQPPKELDYSPAKNVQDIAYGGDVKGVRDVDVPGGEVPAAVPPEVPVETRAEVLPETSLEVAPEVSVEAAAETLAEVPAEAAAEITAETKATEGPIRYEPPKMPILLDDAGAVIKCFYHPEADAVNLCSRCRQYVCGQCNYATGTHPICRNCWDKRAEIPIPAAPAKKKESPKLEKSDKRKAEEEERLREFMQLYEQALPVISTVIKKGADGLPASPLDLMEGLKLRPMLEHAKKLPKPKLKELQEARKDFEQLLMTCIKVAETAADFVSSGGQAIPGEADFSRLASGIETASGLMGELSMKVASLSQPQE